MGCICQYQMPCTKFFSKALLVEEEDYILSLLASTNVGFSAIGHFVEQTSCDFSSLIFEQVGRPNTFIALLHLATSPDYQE